jgi:hypothetical protein
VTHDYVAQPGRAGALAAGDGVNGRILVVDSHVRTDERADLLRLHAQLAE